MKNVFCVLIALALTTTASDVLAFGMFSRIARNANHQMESSSDVADSKLPESAAVQLSTQNSKAYDAAKLAGVPADKLADLRLKLLKAPDTLDEGTALSDNTKAIADLVAQFSTDHPENAKANDAKDTSALAANISAETVANVKPKAPCSLDTSSFCGGVTFASKDQGVGTATDLGTAGNTQSAHVALLTYDLALGDSWHIPLLVGTSVAGGAGAQQDTNKLLLLDPSQGRLSFQINYAGVWRIGPFCNFKAAVDDKTAGSCVIGASLGGRYLNLATQSSSTATSTSGGMTTSADDSSSSKNAFGGFASVTQAFTFPILRNMTQKGSLNIQGSAIYYVQNLNGSTEIFPNAVGADGKAVSIKSDYFGYGVGATLDITDAFSINASFYDAIGNSVVGKKGTFGISYHFAKGILGKTT